MYSGSDLFDDVIHSTQNSVTTWGFVVSIKFWKLVAYGVDGFTQATNVFEHAPAEKEKIWQLAILQLYWG